MFPGTGLLSLRIDTWAFEGIRQNWNDGKSKVVEDGLKEFLTNLVKIAELKRQRRPEDNERERRRLEDLKAMQELERRDGLSG